jgi:conjugative relaxase-like TrwC/TraI family protein
MLTISKPLAAAQAQTYHAKEFTSPDQSYWSRGQSIAGEWQGQLASKFGLSGSVGAEEFARLAQGQNPSSGEQLVQHRQAHQYKNADGKTVTSVEHRAGWDATYSAPKSVSLTALVGGDERVRMAHREAVTAALTELERYTQARIGGNHSAETSGRFIAAKFEHDTARPVDGYAAPQLHTHAVIFNITERAGGSARALQPRSLFESQQFATAVYQSELMFRLRNLGYEIETGRSGAPEIKGYTREYLDASSPRSHQIRAYMERNGFEGHESAHIAAHSTRDKKQILTPAEVFAAHRRLAAEYGNQASHIVAEARARALEQQSAQRPEQSQIRVQEAVTWARDKLFEREAVSDERTIYRDALRRGMGEVRYGEVRANFEARRATGEFQEVDKTKHASGRRFTTRQVLADEWQVVRTMRDGRGQSSQFLPIERAVAHTEAYSHLNAGQRQAVEEVLISHDRVQGIQGYAGVGKTTVLTAIREAAEKNGYAVEGFAPTSRAARQLREAGVSADTLQKFLVRGSHMNQGLKSPHLYMLDESSLASTKQVREFLAKIEPADRVLFVGDTRQHQGVEAGKPFQQLVQAGMKTIHLDQIVRQQNPELKSAVEHLARGDMAAGIESLHRQGRIREIADPRDRIQAIATEYVAHPDQTLIVSPDNASRRAINDAVRQNLQEKGMVSTEGRQLRILIARQEMTGAERRWASGYERGDVLRYARGSQEVGIERCEYARVVVIDPRENLLTVEKQNGEQHTYDPRRLRGVSVYRESDQQFSQGDRIQFTAPDKALGVANRDLAVIESMTGDGRISARLDSGRQIEFDPTGHRHFDHGYAVTSHSSQGLTAERVLVNADTAVHPDLINSRFGYVSVSRASQEAIVFTDNTAKLQTQLSADVSKTSALEVFQPASTSKGAGIALSL